MHVGGVYPTEKRLASRMLALDPVFCCGNKIVIAGLHPLFGEWTGVLDPLLPHPPPTGLLGGIVLVICPAVQDSARPESFAEVGEVLFRWIVVHLRLFLGVQVVEVAIELVKAMHTWQVLVEVTEMVLAELAGGVAQRL